MAVVDVGTGCLEQHKHYTGYCYYY